VSLVWSMIFQINRLRRLSGNRLSQNESYMQRALVLAQMAAEKGEVPIGAVLVYEDKIIAEGFNQPISSHDPTAHAEIIALRAAGEVLRNYRFPGSSLYVTLEPCAMCAGALIHARINRVVFGASDPKGAAQTVFNSPLSQQLNHQIVSEGGCLEAESASMLKAFFKTKR
jgi:tRNA(adenine34) deaminase